MKTRRQIWIENYRVRPYLQHSSEQEIAERLRYVIENMTTTTPDGKIAPLLPEPDGKFWYELFEQVLEEYRRRRIEPPAGFLKGAQVPNPAHPISSAALKAVSEAELPPNGKYLVKLGRRQHISNFYERGELRIAPASIYADPSLNSAIRDDELALSAFGQQSEVLIRVIDPKTGGPFRTHGLRDPDARNETDRKSHIYVSFENQLLRSVHGNEVGREVICRFRV
jgi:hypothetical protein